MERLNAGSRPGRTHRAAFTGLQVVGVSKRFGSVQALQRVGFAIRPGTIHALVGENGAGKSTLGKIVAGVIQPDEGHVEVNGTPVWLRSPRDALEAGIATIEQEISLVPGLTVQENVFLGAEPRIAGVVHRRAMARRWEEARTKSGFNLQAGVRVQSLSLGAQQQVEILRALSRSADLIIMDEPTAALNEREATALHEAIRAVTARGAAVLIVTHFLKEVLALADVITVLREGQLVRTAPAAGETEASLIRAMLGRELSSVFPAKSPPPDANPVVLSGQGVVADGVDGVSVEVRAGEIVGLAGLDGSGRSELARAIYGDVPLHAGRVRVAGRDVGRPTPRRCLKHGVSMVPASRRDDGLFLTRSIAENTTVSSVADLARAGIVRRKTEARRIADVLRRLNVPTGRSRHPVSTLSGGNQQKVLFGRALLRDTVVLIADEPTRGVDIGAKAAIYQLLADLAERGVGILLISSEPEELIGLSHRILVLRRGQVSAELTGQAITEENVLTAALTTVPATPEFADDHSHA